MLVIGANGFVGQYVAANAAPTFDVFEADLTAPSGERGIVMDIASESSVRAGFERATPDVAVLLAAISDIDRCEQQPGLAETVNVGGARHVASACASCRARLVYTSSAAVYDGSRRGYAESDPPNPISVYGRTKAAAEEVILSALADALVVRPALVIGFAKRAGTNAMLNKLEEKLQAGETVSFPDYEFRNPIDAATLSHHILVLLRSESARGIFHAGATEAISRFDLGVGLADKLGFSGELVKRQTEPLPGRAPRGLCHFLLTDRLRTVCRTPVPTCSEVIERAINGSPQSNS